ncbi:hypothetical protein COOONC_18226, partial [Cooperia oncophora]
MPYCLPRISADKDTSLVIELVNARIRFSYKEGDESMQIDSPEERTRLQMLLVDNTTAISDIDIQPELGSVITI